jgi:hypothetical protein
MISIVVEVGRFEQFEGECLFRLETADLVQ